SSRTVVELSSVTVLVVVLLSSVLVKVTVAVPSAAISETLVMVPVTTVTLSHPVAPTRARLAIDSNARDLQAMRHIGSSPTSVRMILHDHVWVRAPSKRVFGETLAAVLGNQGGQGLDIQPG